MAFFTRSFVLLWQGQLVSQLGNQAFFVATAYFALEATGSASVVAAVMMASVVPVAILGPLGGTLADLHSRRAILVVTDVLRALAVGALGLFVLWHPDVSSHHVAVIIAVAVFSGVMSALFSPAVQAFIPDLVPSERLAAANSVSQISSQACMLVGQALGGVLYVSWGAAGLLLFDALSFAYGGVATWLIPADRPRPRERASIGIAIQQYMLETREGIAYVWRRRGMTAVLIVFAGVNFLFMPVFVLLPFYVREVLGGGPEWYGFLLAGSGAGALAGSAAAGVLLGRVRAGARLIRLCVTGVACCVLVLAATRVSWLALAAFIAIGALSSAINVKVVTTFQSAIPADVRGRVMALVVALSTAVVPLGMGLGGLMGDIWRGSLPLVFAGCGAAIAILIAVSSWMAGFGELLDDQGNVPGSRVSRDRA